MAVFSGFLCCFEGFIERDEVKTLALVSSLLLFDV